MIGLKWSGRTKRKPKSWRCRSPARIDTTFCRNYCSHLIAVKIQIFCSLSIHGKKQLRQTIAISNPRSDIGKSSSPPINIQKKKNKQANSIHQMHKFYQREFIVAHSSFTLWKNDTFNWIVTRVVRSVDICWCADYRVGRSRRPKRNLTFIERVCFVLHR